MTTGHEVWLARRSAGLSQREMAKQTISTWERKAGSTVKPSNGAGAKLEAFVKKYVLDRRPKLVAVRGNIFEAGSKELAAYIGSQPSVSDDDDSLVPLGKLDEAFDLDRAPETKRRWWQRLRRNK